MTTLKDAVPTRSALAQLRALAHESITGLDDLRRVTRQQATLFCESLAAPFHEVPEHLPALIPNIRIEYVPDIPLRGVSFWARKHWYIHIRADDPVRMQVTTILHEFKRIIDYPLRGRLDGITGHEWETLAAQFANDVLTAAKPARPGNARMEVTP